MARVGEGHRAVVIAVTVLLLGGSSNAARVQSHSSLQWSGDFETGDLSQWTWGAQSAAPDRIRVVQSPVRHGSYAARFEVRPGDYGDPGERAEVLLNQQTTDGYEGREQFWAWSTYFPVTFDAPMAAWNVFAQFHHTGSTGQANIHFAVVDRSKIVLRVLGGDFDHPARKDFVLARLNRGMWYDFVFHVKWSPSGRLGYVEVWVNRVRIVRKTMTPTLYAGQGVYFKQGYYRSPYKADTVIFQDGARLGSTLGAVVGWYASGRVPQ
jgi:Polysaccharide lyase